MAFVLGSILIVIIWHILKLVINRRFMFLRNILPGTDLVLVTRHQNGNKLEEEARHIRNPSNIFGITVLPLPRGSKSMEVMFVYECTSWSIDKTKLFDSDDYYETGQLLQSNTVKPHKVSGNQKEGSSVVLVNDKHCSSSLLQFNKNCILCLEDFDDGGPSEERRDDDALLRDNLMTMICGHTFHAECSVQMFLKRCYLCPICNKSMAIGYINHGYLPPPTQLSDNIDDDDGVFTSSHQYGTFADS